MKLFSYAFIYAFLVFLLYMVYKVFRFAFFRIKAFIIRRKLSKVAKTDVNLESEKKDD